LFVLNLVAYERLNLRRANGLHVAVEGVHMLVVSREDIDTTGCVQYLGLSVL
jgi:hypothetical protein